MKKRVIFISSTGGHFSELMMLKPIFENYDYHLITEKTKSTISLKDEYKNRMHYLVYGTRIKKVKYFFKVSETVSEWPLGVKTCVIQTIFAVTLISCTFIIIH